MLISNRMVFFCFSDWYFTMFNLLVKHFMHSVLATALKFFIWEHSHFSLPFKSAILSDTKSVATLCKSHCLLTCECLGKISWSPSDTGADKKLSAWLKNWKWWETRHWAWWRFYLNISLMADWKHVIPASQEIKVGSHAWQFPTCSPWEKASDLSFSQIKAHQ